jgi:validoxylamine A 7'-phosphate phosphatase
MTPPDGVVFDLDGTLVLTESRNAVVWQRFFTANGIDYDDGLAHHVMGRRAQDSLPELMHLFPDRPLAELLTEVAEIELDVPLFDVEPVAGAVHLVRQLSDAGMPLALVTSAGRIYAQGLLRELGLLDAFAASVTGEDVTRGKPDPEGYLAACAALNLPAAKVIGFEDSRAGVAAVKSAGMGCIAVATTQPRELLGEADVVLSDFEDLEPVGWLRAIADGTLEEAWRRPGA